MRDLRARLDRKRARLDVARSAYARECRALDTIRETAQNVETALGLAQRVAEQTQRDATARIAALVSRCLRAVLEERAYTLRIDLLPERGRTSARLVFVRNGRESDPLACAGGGAVDLAAFGLRVAALILSRPERRRLLVLDEPLRFVSAEYRPAARALVRELARELRVQVVQVTHDPELQAGEVVRIGAGSA